MRERTYFPRLCLVQVATVDDVALVDVLAIPDGGALTALLADRGRTKLIHAARQDIEALLPLTGSPLGPVFDTQQAAALLGFSAQIGYADLVQQLLSVALAKGHARTDWARRPLSAEQLAYAADDVRYLPALAAELESRLAAAGRREWMAEEAAELDDVSLYRVEPTDAWKRLRGLERLDAPAFRAAQRLAAWREARAMDRDLPRGWVLPDVAIHELAQRRPQSRANSRHESVPRARPRAGRRPASADQAPENGERPPRRDGIRGPDPGSAPAQETAGQTQGIARKRRQRRCSRPVANSRRSSAARAKCR